MEDFIVTFIGGFGAGVLVLIILTLSFGVKPMEEAFKRGFAVECLGKEGYYWECE